MIAGVIAAVSDVRPTGSAFVDRPLVAVAVAAVVWSGASASWWVTTIAAGAATAVAWAPLPTALGLLVTAAGAWIGYRRADLVIARAAVAAGAVLVGCSSQLDRPFGTSAAVVVPVGVAIFVDGIRRRPSVVRRRAWWAAGATVGVAVCVSVLFGLSVLGARAALTEGIDLARGAVRSVRDGDLETGAARFRAAADRFDAADRSLSAPWTEPARAVPIVAQHRRAVVELSAGSADALQAAADALDRIDVDALRVAGGRVDLVALEGAIGPLRGVGVALEELDRTVEQVESPWLLPQVDDRLARVADELGGNTGRFDAAVDALELAPAMLGRDGPRRYLVLFTTPSEARGVGGFPGNYAEVTADGGELSMSGFGRLSDLDRAAFAAGARCEGCAEELLEEYGGFGLTTGPGGAVGEVVWKNITMPAHFPYIAEASAVLYPQSGGRRIDGVAIMDPYVMQAFVGYTGPVELPERGIRIDRSTVLPFVLFEQYLQEDNVDRVDALDVIGRTVIAQLLTGALPEPQVLASDLGPLVSQRRLMFWTDRSDEQEALGRVGLLGDLPAIDPSTDSGFAVTLNNASGNKIDAFVEVGTSTEFVIDDMTGRTVLVATVTISNTAPDDGLPAYVIGNLADRPIGTNRSYVTFFSGVGARSIERDGVAVGLQPGREAGWLTGSTFVDVPAGGSTTFRLEYDVAPGAAEVGVESLVTWTQPLVADRDDLGPLAPARAQ